MATDVDARLIRHNSGGVISTRSGRPWVIKYTEQFSTRQEAGERERYLKKMKSRVYLEKLINAAR